MNSLIVLQDSNVNASQSATPTTSQLTAPAASRMITRGSKHITVPKRFRDDDYAGGSVTKRPRNTSESTAVPSVVTTTTIGGQCSEQPTRSQVARVADVEDQLLQAQVAQLIAKVTTLTAQVNILQQENQQLKNRINQMVNVIVKNGLQSYFTPEQLAYEI